MMDEKLFNTDDFLQRMSGNEMGLPKLCPIILGSIYMSILDKDNDAYAPFRNEETMVKTIEYLVEVSIVINDSSS